MLWLSVWKDLMSLKTKPELASDVVKVPECNTFPTMVEPAMLKRSQYKMVSSTILLPPLLSIFSSLCICIKCSLYSLCLLSLLCAHVSWTLNYILLWVWHKLWIRTKWDKVDSNCGYEWVLLDNPSDSVNMYYYNLLIKSCLDYSEAG